MTDTGTETPSKPFATSLTIQGTAVMLIGVLAPTLAGLFHVEAGDVTTIGGEIVTAVSAVAGLVGGIMAVVGRMRAKTALH